MFFSKNCKSSGCQASVANLGTSVQQLVSISRKTYQAPYCGAVPENLSDKLFIPGSGQDGKHYCYLVDIANAEVICWTIDLQDYLTTICANMSGLDGTSAPWNRSPHNYIEVSHFIHSAEIYNGWIYMSFFHGGFILGVDMQTDAYKIIYDTAIDYHPMYSSTNKIQNGRIYFSRWPAADTFLRAQDRNRTVAIECGYYDLHQQTFVVLHSLNGPDAIHYTDISPDGDTIFLVEMSQHPKKSMPLDENFEQLSLNEKQSLIDAGITLSEMILISNNGGKTRRYHLPIGPAHIEWDQEQADVFYLSSHNLVTNDRYLYTFGNARVDKYRLNKGEIEREAGYDSAELLRGQSHRKTYYSGHELLVIPGYRDRIDLVDCATMQLYKRILLTDTHDHQLGFADGPVRYLPQQIDTTPYTVDTIPGTPFLYLSSLHGVIVYDFAEDRTRMTINFTGQKPVVFVGHSTKIDSLSD
ncbi:hypothetical protein [Serratia sp. 2723]|uniref:hypothetical protein n=1 Tax=unclassified Serratia (in: enterobacteria) TaxID=2647522 RepID=UPI003D22AFB4